LAVYVPPEFANQTATCVLATKAISPPDFSST
jgi:hypothetical protein